MLSTPYGDTINNELSIKAIDFDGTVKIDDEDLYLIKKVSVYYANENIKETDLDSDNLFSGPIIIDHADSNSSNSSKTKLNLLYFILWNFCIEVFLARIFKKGEELSNYLFNSLGYTPSRKCSQFQVEHLCVSHPNFSVDYKTFNDALDKSRLAIEDFKPLLKLRALPEIYGKKVISYLDFVSELCESLKIEFNNIPKIQNLI